MAGSETSSRFHNVRWTATTWPAALAKAKRERDGFWVVLTSIDFHGHVPGAEMEDPAMAAVIVHDGRELTVARRVEVMSKVMPNPRLVIWFRDKAC